MKRIAAVALGLATTIPICAQRAGHAGFASRGTGVSHAAPAFRGGSFAAPAPMRYRGVPVTRAARPYAPAPPMARFAAPSSRYVTVAPPARRPAFYQPQKNHAYSGDHHPRIRTYPIYPVSVVGYFPPDLLDSDLFDEPYYDNSYDDNSAYAQPPVPQPGYADNGYPDNGYAANGYPQPAPESYYPPYPQPQAQQEQAPAITPEVQYVPGSADTVTLIFKDGRPPEQVQNYIATKKTLTVINGSRHYDIPIADLDVLATIKANRETGVGFQLPASTP